MGKTSAKFICFVEDNYKRLQLKLTQNLNVEANSGFVKFKLEVQNPALPKKEQVNIFNIVSWSV